MVIQSSNVNMSAYGVSEAKKISAVSYTGWGGSLMSAISASTTPSATDSEQVTEQNEKENGSEALNYLVMTKSAGAYFVSRDDNIYSGDTKVEYNSLKNLMQLLFPDASLEATEKISTRDLFRQIVGQMRDQANRMLARIVGMPAPTQTWDVDSVSYDLYHESETSVFASSGTVKTGDGRSIDFDVSAVMSRSFTKYSNVEINYKAAMLVDPLVICLDESGVELTDKKFLFDIDADGELDNISLLGEMCGYLALDKNGDGVINDGSELFGTKTGDGFSELAVFDMDNNGWIDENDEIFNHLRVWTKDAQGNDKLVAIGVAGVGAIYLGNLSTQFTLKSQIDNEVQGVIQNSGVYLTEDGEARLIQHVDMAVTDREESQVL